MATIRLRKPLERAIRGGHPWVYADALAPAKLPTGSVVDLVGQDGRFLARGLYDARSPIGLRLYTLDEDEALDGALVGRRLASALAARRGAFDPSDTDAFRLCNGEGDFLPGIVVDVYASVAVVRFDGDAARALADDVVRAVLDVTRPLGVATVHERSRGAQGRTLAGPPPPNPVEVREHGVRFAVDVLGGQKTGTFLDQRENRRAIRPYATGNEVANLFSYTGGFSVHAALAGARRVVSVDSAPQAIAAAQQLFALNGIDSRVHETVCDDAFAWIARTRDAGRRFGLVIVDPPSFAPSERALGKALQAYRRLFAESLALVEENGVLAAASCSSHVRHDAFMEVLRDAGAAARRPLRVLEVRGQPADHPSLPAFPEGRYLKFVLLRAS